MSHIKVHRSLFILLVYAFVKIHSETKNFCWPVTDAITCTGMFPTISYKNNHLMLTNYKLESINKKETKYSQNFHKITIKLSEFKHFQTGALSHFASVRQLIFQSSTIEELPCSEFSKLKNLQTLVIDQIKGLNTLRENCFFGLRLIELRLKGIANMMRIAPKPFSSLFIGLTVTKLLDLQNNRIRELDPKLEQFFVNSNANAKIDVSGNTLNCDCRVLWLLNRVKDSRKVQCGTFDNRENQPLLNILTELKARCSKTAVLKGVHISTNLRNNGHTLEMQLGCFTNSRTNVRALSIAATHQLEVPLVRVYANSTSVGDGGSGDASQNGYFMANHSFSMTPTASLKQQKQKTAGGGSMSRSFTCSLQNIWSNEQKLEILVKMRRPRVTAGGAGQHAITNGQLSSENPTERAVVVVDDNNDAYMLRKQFTTLDMIISVIVTFLLTQIIILLARHAWMRHRNSKKRRHLDKLQFNAYDAYQQHHLQHYPHQQHQNAEEQVELQAAHLHSNQFTGPHSYSHSQSLHPHQQSQQHQGQQQMEQLLQHTHINSAANFMPEQLMCSSPSSSHLFTGAQPPPPSYPPPNLPLNPVPAHTQHHRAVNEMGGGSSSGGGGSTSTGSGAGYDHLAFHHHMGGAAVIASSASYHPNNTSNCRLSSSDSACTAITSMLPTHTGLPLPTTTCAAGAGAGGQPLDPAHLMMTASSHPQQQQFVSSSGALFLSNASENSYKNALPLLNPGLPALGGTSSQLHPLGGAVIATATGISPNSSVYSGVQ